MLVVGPPPQDPFVKNINISAGQALWRYSFDKSSQKLHRTETLSHRPNILLRITFTLSAVLSWNISQRIKPE